MKIKKATEMYAFGVFVVMFTIAVCNAQQSTLLTDIINSYGLKDAIQGGMSAYQSIGILIALVFVLILSGRINKQIIFLILIAFAGLSMLSISLQPGITVFMISFLVFGLGKGLADSTTSSVIADLYSGEQSAKKIGLLHGFYGIGSLLTPFIIKALKNSNFLWNQIYMFSAGLASIVLLYMSVITSGKSSKIFAKANITHKIKIKEVKNFIYFKKNRFLLLSVFCYSGFQIGYFLWISRYVDVYLGHEGMGTYALSLFWMGITFARIFITKLKINKLYIILYGNIAAMLFVVAGIWSNVAIITVICSFFAGFANGATTPIQMFIGCRWYEKNTILVTTLINLIFNIAQITCPLLIGALNSINVQFAMTTCAVFALFVAIFTIPLIKDSD